MPQHWPDYAHKIDVCTKANGSAIAPVGQAWDSFFLNGPEVNDDFMTERPSQQQTERESF